MWPWPCPFQGWFVIGRLGHAMINVPTKFEVSTVSRYGDMKCVKMHKIWFWWFGVVRGHPRSWAMSPFDRAHTISYSSLIETMRLSCTVFELQLVICRNSPTLPYPTCIWRPRWGWPQSNFEKNIWRQKTRVPGLSYGIVCVILRLAVLVELRLVTDRRTDRQTDGHTTMAYTARAELARSLSDSWASCLVISSQRTQFDWQCALNTCKFRPSQCSTV